MAVKEVTKSTGCDTEYICSDILLFFTYKYISSLLFNQFSCSSGHFIIGFWYFDNSYSDLSVACVLLRL